MVSCLTVWCVLFASAISAAQCARVLGVFHTSSYSHFVLGETLLKELARKGNDVTMISCFPQKTPVNNYRDIPLHKPLEIIEERRKHGTIFEKSFMPIPLMVLILGEIGLKLTEVVFQEDGVQNLLNSNEKFDLVIVEDFLNDAHKSFGYRFNAPLIVISTVGSSIWTNHLVGNPNSIAYASAVFLGFSSHMTFIQRIVNTLITTYAKIYYNLYFFNKQNQIIQRYIPNAPHIHDIMSSTSLVLLNSHGSYASIKPHMPTMIEIGGFHVKEAKELPKDLKEFLDNSKKGAIYFSLGGNLKSRDMPKEKVEAILKGIGKLKMNVLWKFEDETLSNIPTNLKIGQWFPQQSILAHPNVKLFITHGGLLSIIESLHYGIPIVGIPIFGDQNKNMAEAVEKGFGCILQYTDIQEDNFYSAIQKVTNNASCFGTQPL